MSRAQQTTPPTVPPMNRCTYVVHDSKGGDRRCVLLSCHSGLCDYEPEQPAKLGPLDFIEAHLRSAREYWVASEDLDAALSYLEELRRAASAAGSNYRDMWHQVCGQIGEMCEFLGVDPKERLVDAWTLRDEIIRLKSERDRYAAALEELSDGVCNSKCGPGCDTACKRVAWRALNP